MRPTRRPTEEKQIKDSRGQLYWVDTQGVRRRVNPKNSKAANRKTNGRRRYVPFGNGKPCSDDSPICIKVEAYRAAKNLSQRQLAAECRCTKSAICDIESGRRNGSHKLLQRIAHVLKVDLSETIVRKP